MTKEQIKMEIVKTLDEIPENLLIEVFKVLKSVKNPDKKELEIVIDLNRILIEEKELFIKLAS